MIEFLFSIIGAVWVAKYIFGLFLKRIDKSFATAYVLRRHHYINDEE